MRRSRPWQKAGGTASSAPTRAIWWSPYMEKALTMTKHLQMERYEVLEAMHNQVPLKCGPIQ